MKVSLLVFVCCLSLMVSVPALQAGDVHQLNIFTDNGGYNNSTDVNLYVEILEAGVNIVDFKFHNDSLIECSIAEVYFDDGALLGIASITGSTGVSFSQPATPGDLPSGNTLIPPFVTTAQFSVDSDPPPTNGVNPGELLSITFDLQNDNQLEDVLNDLSNGGLRIGAHIIALPDGSSESAVTTPEPATICLLGLGSPVFLRKRRA
jgi:hypothetical protein